MAKSVSIRVYPCAKNIHLWEITLFPWENFIECLNKSSQVTESHKCPFADVVSLHCDSEESHTDLTDLTDILHPLKSASFRVLLLNL